MVCLSVLHYAYLDFMTKLCFTTVEQVLPSFCLCLTFMCLRSSLILESSVLFNFLHLGVYTAYVVHRPLDCEIKVKYLYTLNIVGEKHIQITFKDLGRFCGFSS